MKKFYCSNKCRLQGQIVLRVTIPCSVCGDSIEDTLYKIVSGRAYCSTECHDFARSSEARRFEIKCKYCNSVYRRRRAEAGDFCSKDCRAKYYSGERNPNWKGGRFHRKEYTKRYNQKYRYWKEVLPMIESMEEEERKRWMEVINASIEEKLKINELRRAIRKGA